MSRSQPSIAQFEFYEYNIQKYDSYEPPTNPQSFGNFRKRKDTNNLTKGIEAREKPRYPDDEEYSLLESSVDPIVSDDTLSTVSIPHVNIPGELNYVNYLEKYKEWRTKVPIGSYEHFYNAPKITKIQQTIRDATQRNQDYIIHKMGSFPSQNVYELNESAFLFKLNVPDNEKIIMFGDFHGSFHTFIRNLARLHVLGVLNLSNRRYIINDGFRLVFLGDIIDRGNYGLDIIYILSKFIIDNNTEDNLKIIIHRGNHEEYEQYSVDGFREEYYRKMIKINPPGIKTHSDELFINFFSYLPTASVMNYHSKKYWMCHGGIPYVKPGFFRKKIYKIPESASDVIYIPYTRQTNRIDTRIATQIRWNDFSNSPNTVVNRERGVGYIIGIDYMKDFLTTNHIDFIIRGHNDNYYNSFILCRAPFRNKISENNFVYNLSKVPLEPQVVVPKDKIFLTEKNPGINFFFSKIPQNQFNQMNVVDGSVATINTNSIPTRGIPIGGTSSANTSTIFYPVITISTNTDNKRYLTRDSFMLLRTHVPSSENHGLFNLDYIRRINKNINNIKHTPNQMNRHIRSIPNRTEQERYIQHFKNKGKLPVNYSINPPPPVKAPLSTVNDSLPPPPDTQLSSVHGGRSKKRKSKTKTTQKSKK